MIHTRLLFEDAATPAALAWPPPTMLDATRQKACQRRTRHDLSPPVEGASSRSATLKHDAMYAAYSPA